MIARLVGEVAAAGAGELVLDVRGVGYRVAAGARLCAELQEGQALTLHISTQVREDAITLVGFLRAIERDAFEILITLPKIGPKLALALLDHLGLGKLSAAVERDDVRALAEVPGVGRRTAERLVLELRGKLPVDFAPQAAAPKAAPSDPLPLALAQLGYRKSEIDLALAGLHSAGLAEADLQARLSASLKILSGGSL